MSYQTLNIERHDAVVLIRIHRPEAMNALNMQVMRELIEVFALFDSDPTQRCAVLTGNDKAFAAGADIKEMPDTGFADMFGDDPYAGYRCIAATRKPWFAAVAGLALGGGCELAMMADFILAADTAKFGQPEIQLGIAPGTGGTQRLARAVGKAKAMEMCLSGRMMGAEEAERASLVSRIVPAAELIDEALITARRIAAMPPLAAIANKEMVNIAFETGLAAGMLFERRLYAGLCATEDKAEGVAAFVEKRPGRFEGR